jgi:hypothetical protein
MNYKFWEVLWFVNRRVCWRVCENFISQLFEIRDVKGFTIIHLNYVNTHPFEKLVFIIGWCLILHTGRKAFLNW